MSICTPAKVPMAAGKTRIHLNHGFTNSIRRKFFQQKLRPFLDRILAMPESKPEKEVHTPTDLSSCCCEFNWFQSAGKCNMAYARLGRRVSKEKSVKDEQAAQPNPKLNQTYEGSPPHLCLVILRFALPEKHQQRQSHAAHYQKYRLERLDGRKNCLDCCQHNSNRPRP